MTTCPPHHYVLPEANGPIAVGRCRYCGVERAFSNTPAEYVRASSWRKYIYARRQRAWKSRRRIEEELV